MIVLFRRYVFTFPVSGVFLLMRYIWQHIEAITDTYDGTLPLSHFLKGYFKKHTRLGSRDRKVLADMAYSWYRCSKGFDEALSFEQRLQACLFLCETTSPHITRFLPEAWGNAGGTTAGRISFLEKSAGIIFRIQDILPFIPVLSDGIHTEEWLASMLRQPRLFIRIVASPEQVMAQLEARQIAYRRYEHVYGNGKHSLCLSLPNTTPVNKILPPNTYVVQDLTSQKTGHYFHTAHGKDWWDCCAGAGGKSLLLRYIEPGARIVASDRRQTILSNLAARFGQYGLAAPDIRTVDVADVTALQKILKGESFDHIICDAPCSGSGTWARTPEQLFFARESDIRSFGVLQRQIAGNVLDYLRPGGRLIYITCSVFREENEMVSRSLAEGAGASLTEEKLINGMAHEADSMYVAVLERKTN